MNLRAFIALAIFFAASAACQELPQEPEPIDIDSRIPMVVNDTTNTVEDVFLSITVLENDTLFAEGIPLTLDEIITDPLHGMAEITGDSIRYEPFDDVNGRDSLQYVASSDVLSASAWAFIDVIPVNDTPRAQNDNFEIEEDNGGEDDGIATINPLANDIDVDGDELLIISVTEADHGELTIEDGSHVLYQPDENFFGADSFTYAVVDPIGEASSASVNILVTAVNDAPMGVADEYQTPRNTPLVVQAPGILANDSDVDEEPIEARIVVTTSSGSLQLQPTGAFTYSPNAGFTGTDRFRYQVTDGIASSPVIAVTITVN